MISTVSRVFVGFLLACLTAGLVQVLFILTPGRIVAMPADIFPDRIGQSLVLAALAATHTAIFSSAFVLIAVGLGEFMRVRNIGYYIAAGVVIALAGLAVQYSSEVAGQPTILNAYAVEAFLASGFLAGAVYWLAAGRSAGGQPREAGGADDVTSDSEPKRRWRDRPRIDIADASLPGTKEGRARRRDTLSERLAREEARVDAEKRAVEAARAAADRPVEKAGIAVAPKAASEADGDADALDTAPIADDQGEAPDGDGPDNGAGGDT